MNYLLQFILKIGIPKNRSKLAKGNSGLTMIELLVGAVIAFIIITPLMGMVVGLLNDDQKESAKATTEQEVQAALDYIAEDVSQAVYIYDQDGIGKITANAGTSPIPTNIGTPVLVFWKRTVVPNAIPLVPNCSNDTCKDDSFVMSLVAYYLQQSSPNSVWCSDTIDSTKCPLNITRVEIRDGVKNPSNYLAYLNESESTIGRDAWFNPNFNLAQPKALVRGNSTGSKNASSPIPQAQVLASYIDHSTNGTPALATCKDVLNLSNDDLTKLASQGVTADELRVGDKSSFYACVDSQKNLARVYIRGNALRRTQTDANYTDARKAYFPTGTIQVQGNSRLGG